VQIERTDLLQNPLRIGLEDIPYRKLGLFRHQRLDGQQLLNHDLLGYRILELVIDHHDLVEFFCGIPSRQQVTDALRLGKIEGIEDIHLVGQDRHIASAEEIKSLAADRHNRRLQGAVLLDLLEGPAADVGVETAAEAAVGGDHDITDLFDFAHLQQGMLVALHPAGDVTQNLFQLVRIGPRAEQLVLGLAQLGRCHHLHRLGDLLCAAHAGDAALDRA